MTLQTRNGPHRPVRPASTSTTAATTTEAPDYRDRRTPPAVPATVHAEPAGWTRPLVIVDCSCGAQHVHHALGKRRGPCGASYTVTEVLGDATEKAAA